MRFMFYTILYTILLNYELHIRVSTYMTLVGPPSAYVEKSNTTQLPFLKIHFLFQCEEGLLCFAEHLEFHYRLID